jgi:hypothetical protein
LTLPVDTVHVGSVIGPIVGARVPGFTVNEKVAVTGEQSEFRFLSVFTVIVTSLETSASEGVYVKANCWVLVDAGLTVPVPSEVIVTPVALPPKVFPLTVTGEVPHVLPVLLVKVKVGGSTHPQDT